MPRDAIYGLSLHKFSGPPEPPNARRGSSRRAVGAGARAVPSARHAVSTRAAADVGPYHAPPPCRLVGRDVPGAPRPRNAPRGRQREPTGTRAAEDVGPYHAPPPCRLVGRDVPGAPRPRNAHWDANGNAPWTRAAEGAALTQGPPWGRGLHAQSESAQTIPHATRIIGRSPARRACRTCRASVRPPRGRRAAHPPQTPRGSARGA